MCKRVSSTLVLQGHLFLIIFPSRVLFDRAEAMWLPPPKKGVESENSQDWWIGTGIMIKFECRYERLDMLLKERMSQSFLFMIGLWDVGAVSIFAPRWKEASLNSELDVAISKVGALKKDSYPNYQHAIGVCVFLQRACRFLFLRLHKKSVLVRKSFDFSSGTHTWDTNNVKIAKSTSPYWSCDPNV